MAHPIFCDVCNIGVSSEVSMRDHVKGRRHQQTLGAMERRKALARNSLYCHGFPPSIPTADLRGYFQRFGPVSRIMVETHKGCYCIVQYDSEAPIQKALSQRNHQFQGCSLTVRPRKPITPHRRPPETERSQRKARASKEEEDQADASHEQLMATLLQADTVLAQMEMLYETMRLSDAEVERRKKVCEYLHSVLSPFFPTCTIHQFGSSVNGFGMKGCDMDIFLDLHDTDVSLQWEETLRHKLKPVNLPYIREIQSLKTTEGPLMPSQLRQLSLVHRVKLMSRILMQHAHHCVEVLFVPSVRCPIVRFVHSPTGIKCDLSINNRLALRNTQLLRMCAEDHRVRLLVFAVRYWGRWKQVAGNQNCGPRLSNYCLSLLVLFFLANTSPPLLLSVQALADLTEPGQKCVIEEWDCSLPEAVPPSTNTQPADELLHQFFQFYHQVSLPTSVILTRTGTVMPLNDFLMEKANSPHLNDFKVKALAVQDPFVLQHNIAQNISNQIRDLLIQEIDYAATKTSTWSPSACNTPAGPESSKSTDSQASQPLWGLPYLFSTQDCTPPAPQATVTAASSWCEKAGRDPVKSASQWTYPISLDLSTLSPLVLQALRTKGDYRAVWFRRVRTLLVWVLREVFLFAMKTDRDGEALEEGGEESEEGEEQMCVEEEEGGSGVDAECALDRVDSPIAKVGSPEVEGQCVGLSSSEQSKEQVSSAEENCATLGHVEDVNLMQADVVASSTGAPEVTMKEKSPVDCVDASPGGAQPAVEKEGSESDFTAATVGAGEDGGMPSPHSEHSCSMHSPGEASPMSELSHLSPTACEGKSSPAEPPCVQAHVPVQCSQSDCHPKPCDPCSQLPAVPENKGVPVSSASREVPSTSECCDVEMAVDSDGTVPALNHMDSPTVQSSSRDLPSTCPAGETGAGSSVLPLSVEFSPVGGGKVYVSANSQVSTCPSETAPQCTDVSNSNAQTEQTPLEKAVTNNTSRPHRTRKCRPFRIYCEGSHKAWYGRKPTRTSLIAEGHADNLELEKLVSKQIAEREAGSTAPPLRFYCTLSPVPKGDRPEAEISFEPAESLPKEFSVFPTFFKSYFTKLVSKNLLESATV